MSLTTIARVKAALSIPSAVTFHDTSITAAVSYANDVVLSAIGQPGGLVATTRTDYPKVYKDSQIDVYLERAPVVSIIAVTNAESVVETNEYRMDPETGLLRLLRGSVGTRRLLASWSNVPDDVVVTYLHGYTEATVPERLRQAATMIAAHNVQQVQHLGKTQVRNSSYGFSVDAFSVPAAAARILSEFEDVHHS